MKKLSALLLALLMTVSLLAGCAGKSADATDSPESTTDSSYEETNIPDATGSTESTADSSYEETNIPDVTEDEGEDTPAVSTDSTNPQTETEETNNSPVKPKPQSRPTQTKPQSRPTQTKPQLRPTQPKPQLRPTQPTTPKPTVTPNKPETISVISIQKALELCGEDGNVTTERYYIRGTIETITNAQYGAMVITDGTGSISVYGTYSEDGSVGYADMKDKPYKGDEVLLYCILQNFNGQKEIKNARLISFKKAELDINEADYTAMTIAEAREAAKGALVKTGGIVARITYANGMKPNGFYLVDDTQSIYVYDSDLAQRVKAGNKITILASKTYWILDKEIEDAQKFGYQGCCQLENAYLKDNDEKTDNTFSKSWIPESTVKEIMDTPLSTNITSTIFKVNALVTREDGKGFLNYYFKDLDGTTGSYTYTQCSGSDFEWLDQFDGKICTVYLSVLNAKATNSSCVYRFVPIDVVDEGYTFDTDNAAEFAVKYYGIGQFDTSYSGDPAMEVTTSVSSELLGFSDAKLSYFSSNENVVKFTSENGKLVMHCTGYGEASVKVVGSYNGKEYSQTVEITVAQAAAHDSITVEQAANAQVGEIVTVKGIIGPSLVNKQGFYLIDDTGVIAVTLDDEKMEGLAIGQEIILQGKRDRFLKDGVECYGHTALTNCDILANYYGKNAYSDKAFITGKTLADFAKLNVNEDHSRDVYVLKATIAFEETPYYTSVKLTDGDTQVQLYCSSGKQYSWLKQYAGKEVTVELAACNWNSKPQYAGCVLSVITEDGKVCNELNFKH